MLIVLSSKKNKNIFAIYNLFSCSYDQIWGTHANMTVTFTILKNYKIVAWTVIQSNFIFCINIYIGFNAMSHTQIK